MGLSLAVDIETPLRMEVSRYADAYIYLNQVRDEVKYIMNVRPILQLVRLTEPKGP
jgi:hypothetical protein